MLTPARGCRWYASPRLKGCVIRQDLGQVGCGVADRLEAEFFVIGNPAGFMESLY